MRTLWCHLSLSNQVFAITMSSSSQINELLTTEVQCFDSTAVFPFSDTDKLDKFLSCDDIWDESFDDVSDCLECFNLNMTGLLST